MTHNRVELGHTTGVGGKPVFRTHRGEGGQHQDIISEGGGGGGGAELSSGHITGKG